MIYISVMFWKKITETLFKKGIDLNYLDPDAKTQNYYIKVEAYAGKKESGTFELSFESKQIEVSKSPVKVEVGEGACPQKEVIKEIKNEKTNEKTKNEIITY